MENSATNDAYQAKKALYLALMKNAYRLLALK